MPWLRCRLLDERMPCHHHTSLNPLRSLRCSLIWHLWWYDQSTRKHAAVQQRTHWTAHHTLSQSMHWLARVCQPEKDFSAESTDGKSVECVCGFVKTLFSSAPFIMTTLNTNLTRSHGGELEVTQRALPHFARGLPHYLVLIFNLRSL